MADDPLPPTTWLRLPTTDHPAPAPPPTPPGAAPLPAAAQARPLQGGAGTFSGAQVDPATTQMRRQSQSRLLWAGVIAAVVLTVVGLVALLPVLYLLYRG